MRRFEKYRRIIQLTIIAAALACATVPGAGTADAADGTLRVYETTFNDFTNAVKPIKVTGHHKFQITIDAWIFGKHKITICDSNYTANITGMTYDVKPGGVSVDGTLDVNWCNLTFSNSNLDATGNVYYSTGDSSVHFSFASASIQPCFNVGWEGFSFHVCLPLHINIAPTLNIPPVPIRPAFLTFETGSGPKRLYMKPRSVSLMNRDGYIEIQSNVDVQ